jgi:hypothetical protein
LCHEDAENGTGSLRLELRCAHCAHPGVERRLYVAFHVTHTSIVYARNYQQAAWRSS